MSGRLPLTGLVLAIIILSGCGPSAEHKKNEEYVAEQRTLEQSTVLLNNSKDLVPLVDLSTLSIASINFGSAYANEFDSILNKYTPVRSVAASDFNTLKEYNTLIVQLTDDSFNDPQTVPFLLERQKDQTLILSLAGNRKNLALLEALHGPVILSDTVSVESAVFAAQLIFGGVGASAKLTERVSPRFTAGAGYSVQSVRLKYTVPEEVGINVADLEEVDQIAQEAIRKRAAPSISVMVVIDGKVILKQAYGTHTYDDTTRSAPDDMYDLASVTKTSATTLAVMRLYEEGKLKLDTHLGAYLPEARKTNKNKVILRDLMLHQAGLVSFIPFHRTVTSADHRRDSSAAYPTKVAPGYFIRQGYYSKVMLPRMLKSAIGKPGTYVYSDLSMYFMKEIVERQGKQPIEVYVEDQFYRPLGMARTLFNPWKKFRTDEIVPTEDDRVFRKALLQGYVHDQGAALAGGVAGHAGLFSTTNDLAILYQMLLNRGSYGGTQYFKPETVDMFTERQSAVSRRGLGFDGWDPDRKKGFPSELASPQTYGHTGYTGTCVWVDPKYKLVYIFLSNRVNPTVTDKLAQLNIRGRIQDVIYKAILKAEK